MWEPPLDPRDLFVEGDELEGAQIVSAKVNKRGDSIKLTLDNGGGLFVVDIRANNVLRVPEGSLQRATIEFDYDEPPGAGADPYGRPSPQAHPEAWTE